MNIKNFKQKISKIKIKPVDIVVLLIVLGLSSLVIVPSLVQCVENRNMAKCKNHMGAMVEILSNEIGEETQNGETYWRDLIKNGNYQKLVASLNDKTSNKNKFPDLNYYIKADGEKITLLCKKHKTITDKTVKFSLMQDVSVEVAEQKQIGEEILYLRVSGQDTYYQNDTLDNNNHEKMVFKGREVDDVINNLTVTAVYAGGASEELPRSRYTVMTKTLNMSKSGQTQLIIKSSTTSVWDNSAYAPFIIDVIGEDDIAPLVVDGELNGRFKLASWEWSDYVVEAAVESVGKEFGASIIQYNGSYYYYPDGMKIVNSNKNNSPFKFALDITDEDKPAYYIKFDTNSVILNKDEEEDVHNGSVKVEKDLIYIWQEQKSKELDKGWIRVYCELKKY